jgi:uncharacterized protein YdaU (DUF1376 family)
MANDKQKPPAYQWYPKDYDTDEAVKLMTYEEEGIYRRLLDHQWLHGGIPAVVEKIARLVPKVPFARFKKLWPSMAAKFAPQGDRLVNARLERQRGDTDEFHEEKRAGGIASAEARRQKYGTAQPPSSARTALEQPPEQPVRGVQPEQPEPASASASASAEHDRARGRNGSGAMEGALPRDHRTHAACDASFSRCVPSAVHAKLVNHLAPKHGGDRAAAGDALHAWYPTVWASLPADFVMGDAFRFWQGRFDQDHASKDSASSRPQNTAVPGADETRKKYLEGR